MLFLCLGGSLLLVVIRVVAAEVKEQQKQALERANEFKCREIWFKSQRRLKHISTNQPVW